MCCARSLGWRTTTNASLAQLIHVRRRRSRSAFFSLRNRIAVAGQLLVSDQCCRPTNAAGRPMLPAVVSGTSVRATKATPFGAAVVPQKRLGMQSSLPAQLHPAQYNCTLRRLDRGGQPALLIHSTSTASDVGSLSVDFAGMPRTLAKLLMPMITNAISSTIDFQRAELSRNF